MTRILFLDDSPARRKWAEKTLKTAGNYIDTSASAFDAICAFGHNRFDVVYLDHDLNEEAFEDSSVRNCGMEVVRWIVANKPTIGEIIVHSMNTPAGHEMVQKLQEAGYTAKYRSFYRMIQDKAGTT